MHKFNLYSTEGCHLCEAAFDLCVDLGLAEHINVIDIVEEADLVKEYGVHIPVLEKITTGTKLFWPFTKQDITKL